MFMRASPALGTSTKMMAARGFSHQGDMQSFDFSEKLNLAELKLKDPTNT